MNSLKKKTQYPYNDQITFELVEEGDVHFRVITNEKGTFIDLRKFFYDKPSQKGIRLSMSKEDIKADNQNSSHFPSSANQCKCSFK